MLWLDVISCCAGATDCRLQCHAVLYCLLLPAICSPLSYPVKWVELKQRKREGEKQGRSEHDLNGRGKALGDARPSRVEWSGIVQCKYVWQECQSCVTSLLASTLHPVFLCISHADYPPHCQKSEGGVSGERCASDAGHNTGHIRKHTSIRRL